jgi:signal transduction histidine kinase
VKSWASLRSWTVKASGTSIVGVLALLASSSLIAAEQQPKKVLVFFSEDINRPALRLINEAMRKTLKSPTHYPMDIASEYLDNVRNPVNDYELELVNLLRKKYAGVRFDVIFLVGTRLGLSILLKNQLQIFRDSPIVFLTLSATEVAGTELGSNVTGVWFDRYLKPTLKLALDLHPGTQRVVVIAGTGSVDEFWMAKARAEFREYEEQIAFTYLSGLTPTELAASVASLREHTIVFQVSVTRDRGGNTYYDTESLLRFASTSSAPIYGTLDTQLGAGIVGGQISSFEALGREGAEVGLRILSGEEPKNLAPHGIPSVAMFDWRELRRWGISETRLPPGSVVRFRVPSFWDLYQWRVISVIGFITFQSMLIFVLLIQRSRRKRVEGHLQQTQSELAHIGRVLITGELAATIAHEVNQPLTAMVANANAARRMLGAGDENLGEAREAIEDIVKDAHRASAVVARIRALLKKGSNRREPLAINTAIEEVVGIVSGDLMKQRVSLRIVLADELPSVEADRVEIQQVLLNLLMNAVEAMGRVEDPRRNHDLTLRSSRDQAGDVLVEVKDSGTGISAENLERIFEPFYTTRPEGMGMGLSICRTIVEAHGGRLWAESNDDQGATLRLVLPALTARTQWLS